MELVVILFWLGFGIAAMMIANGKGRSGCGFFLLGVLLGPLGVLFAFLAKDNRPDPTAAGLVSGELRKCPSCAEVVKAEALRCRFCQSELTPLPFKLKVDHTGAVACPHCKAVVKLEESEIAAGAFTCPTCGKTVNFMAK